MSSRKAITGLAMILSGLTSAGAMATDGTVKFNGEIVDTPCIVATDSADQTVSLGKVKASTFKAVKDISSDAAFTIKLEECTTDVLKSANVTFTGSLDSTDKTLLAQPQAWVLKLQKTTAPQSRWAQPAQAIHCRMVITA